MVPEKSNTNKVTWTAGIILFYCGIVIMSSLDVVELTELGLIILLIVLSIWFLKEKHIKRFIDIWNSLVVEKAKNLYTIFTKDILTSVKHLQKIVLFLIITNIISISLIPTCSYLNKKHYEKITKEEEQYNQKVYSILAKTKNDKSVKLSELETENSTYKSEKSLEEEKDKEKQERNINKMSIKELRETGNYYYRKEKYKEAKKYFEEALSRKRYKDEDSRDLGYCSYYMGGICRRENNYRAAIDHSIDAYNYLEKTQYKKMMAHSAYEAGFVLSNKIKDYEKGIKWFNIALEIFKEIGDLEKVTEIRHELASAYEKNRDKKNALKQLYILHGQYKESKQYTKMHKVEEDIERVNKIGFFK